MLAFLIAAGVAIWGTFEKLTTFKHGFNSSSPAGVVRETVSSSTWWKFDVTPGPPPSGWFPPYGMLPAIGAGLLVVGAILALTTFAGRRSGLVTAIRVSAGVGIGVVAGAVSIRLLDALAALDRINSDPLEPGESVDFKLGLGIYLPGGAALVGLIGLLLTLNRGRTARIEPATPRIGFPMPYQPYQQAYAQQPTSQPVPVQQPTSQPFPAQPSPAQQPPSEPLPAPQAPDEPGRTAPQ
jgi:hypothetical protein